MKNLIFALILIITSAGVQSQSVDSSAFALQLDLSPFALKGYSVKGVWYPAKFQRGSVGLEVFAMEFPDFYFRGENEGWTGQVDYAVDLSVDFALSGHRYRGLFAGPIVVYLHNSMAYEGEAVSFDVLQMGGKVAYRWYPFSGRRFYLNPYAVVGVDVEVGGDSGTYEPARFTGLGSLFVGWRL